MGDTVLGVMSRAEYSSQLMEGLSPEEQKLLSDGEETIEVDTKQYLDKVVEALPTINVEYYRRVLLVYGIPTVDTTKVDKLSKYIKKEIKERLTQHGLPKAVDFHFPLQEDGSTEPFFFLILRHSPSADGTKTLLQGAKIASMNLRCYSVDEWQQLNQAANMSPGQGETRDARQWYIVDQHDKYHQLGVLVERECQIRGLDLQENGVDLLPVGPGNEGVVSDVLEFAFSPSGGTLATIHAPRKDGATVVEIRGGTTLSVRGEIVMDRCRAASVCPNDRFLVTVRDCGDAKKERMQVWDIQTHTCVYSTGLPPTSERESLDAYIGWSPDGSAYAFAANQMFSIYSVDSHTHIPGLSPVDATITRFSWHSQENLLAYFVPMNGSIAGRLQIVRVPENETVGTKHSMISDMTLLWHPAAPILATYFTPPKSVITQVEVHLLHRPKTPAFASTLETSDVMSMAWLPIADRLAVLYREKKSTTAMFRTYKVTNKEIKIVNTTELTAMFTRITPSPNGYGFVLWWPYDLEILRKDNQRHTNPGTVAFCVMNEDALSILKTDDYRGVQRMSWHSSSAVVCGSIAAGDSSGFRIWTMLGEQCKSMQDSSMRRFQWRNSCPNVCLTAANLADLRTATKDTNMISKYQKLHKELTDKTSKQMRDNAQQDAVSFMDLTDELKAWVKTL